MIGFMQCDKLEINITLWLGAVCECSLYVVTDLSQRFETWPSSGIFPVYTVYLTRLDTNPLKTSQVILSVDGPIKFKIDCRFLFEEQYGRAMHPLKVIQQEALHIESTHSS